MFDWFKKKPKPQTYEMKVTGVSPETDNEFMFYEFVRTTSTFILKPWIKKCIEIGYKIKPDYQSAVNIKLKTGSFTNPHKFPGYFQNKFDYIAIDFETANNSRISACAIGLCFVKNGKIVHSTKHFIKPPKEETFLKRNTDIHNIKKSDVAYAMTFDKLWRFEFQEYFCNNLIIFHNASMDLSVLKNLFEHYKINPFEISYIDTMSFADKLGYPKTVVELAKAFNIDVKNLHDPEADAETCSSIFDELIKISSDYKDLIRKIDSRPKEVKHYQNTASPEVISENENYIELYAITDEELQELTIATKGFIVTGTFAMDREIITAILMKMGGQLKTGITAKVDYVIVGRECGWSKIQKVNELNKKGCNIKFISEQELQILIDRDL